MAGIKVLLVDSNRDVRDSLCEIFLSSGYQVQLAETAPQALDRLRRDQSEHTPDIVVLGQRYLESDRSFFLRSLQKEIQSTGKNISVVVLSTFQVNIPLSNTESGTRAASACLLSSIAKLLTMVRGLTAQKAAIHAESASVN